MTQPSLDLTPEEEQAAAASQVCNQIQHPLADGQISSNQSAAASKSPQARRASFELSVEEEEEAARRVQEQMSMSPARGRSQPTSPADQARRSQGGFFSGSPPASQVAVVGAALVGVADVGAAVISAADDYEAASVPFHDDQLKAILERLVSVDDELLRVQQQHAHELAELTEQADSDAREAELRGSRLEELDRELDRINLEHSEEVQQLSEQAAADARVAEEQQEQIEEHVG